MKFKTYIHHSIKQVNRKFTNLFQYTKLYLKSKKQSGKPIIVAEINDFNHGRYAYILINYLSLAGYEIAFEKSTNFLLNLHDYDRFIFDIPTIRIYNNKDGKKDISFRLLINSTESKINVTNNAKIIHVNFEYFGQRRGINCQIDLPYYMHPLTGRYFERGNYTQATCKNGILFYGQQDVNKYDFFINTVFKLNSRNDVFLFLKEHYHKKFEPKTYKELNRAINSQKENVFYFLDAQYFRIPTKDWLGILSSFGFFIATPGMIMPQCHNIIEAMAMGVVPILQFPDAFHPKLQHEVNCIVFNELEELPDIINELLIMDKWQKRKMSQNILEYYIQHISPVSFRKKLNESKCSRIELFINAEEKSLII